MNGHFSACGIRRIFQPTTLCREGENTHLNIAFFLLLPMEGIKPGLAVQQASELFIALLPLGFRVPNEKSSKKDYNNAEMR